MDVYDKDFWERLPDILEEIAGADFVAIDLEMTGIKPHKIPKMQRPTKEHIYSVNKTAAETFHILQLGVTCIAYKASAGFYRLTTYNFYVSPMFSDSSEGTRLGRMLDRTLTISYEALLFLRANRIRIEDSYGEGIPYLSREEEKQIRPSFLLEETSQARDLIDLADQDAETQSFYNEAKTKLALWDADVDGKLEYINISNPYGENLNRFQQRLVYQLVEKEYPGKYRAHCKFNCFMQILRADDPTEKKLKQSKKENRGICLKTQRGMRYIMEALVGGNFAEATLDVIARGPRDTDYNKNLGAKLSSYEKKLKERPPVLVGHNMFTDLCFVYKAFFGALPESLPDFTQRIHGLFPRVVDTKHLATQGEHSMHAAENLEELYKQTNEQPMPPVYGSYCVSGRTKVQPRSAHHAGYDSHMTAILFIQKIWQMSNDQRRGSETAAPSLDTKVPGTRLPDWESVLFQAYSNKLRIGNAGTLELDAEEACD